MFGFRRQAILSLHWVLYAIWKLDISVFLVTNPIRQSPWMSYVKINPRGTWTCNHLTSLLNYVSHGLFVLRASHVFAPLATSRFTFFTYALYLRTFLYCESFLGWICSPSKTFHFLRTIKITTNLAVSGESFKHICSVRLIRCPFVLFCLFVVVIVVVVVVVVFFISFTMK